MTGHKFKPRDKVRVLETYALDVGLHCRTGTVLGYSERPVYAVVVLNLGGSYFFLDTELELVTDCGACGAGDPDCASCEAGM